MVEVIEVRDLSQSKKLGLIERKIHFAAGWRWCWYKGRRYQVRGGMRVNTFINISNPIPQREKIYG